MMNASVSEPNAATISGATVTKTSMTVSWSVPSGGVDQYEIRLNEQSGSKQIIKQKRTTSATFTELTPGTKYTVKLVTVRDKWRITTPDKDKVFYTSKCVFIHIKVFRRIRK